MATQKMRYMTAQRNNGIKIGVAFDNVPHENIEVVRDNNEEVEVIRWSTNVSRGLMVCPG